MKKHLQFITSTKQLPIIAVILLFFVMSVSVQAQMPIAGNDALRCGAGELTLEVSWSGAALNPDNVKWYTQPFYGTPIATGLSYTTPYLEFTVPYYVDYIGDEGCSQCDRLLIRAVIADQVITPQVLYSSVTFCNSIDQNFVPTIVGASGGSFSVSPLLGAGSFNTATGAFNPSGLQTGVYVVTFNPTEIIGCNSNAVTVNLSVNTAPVQPVISYQFDSYCSSSEAAAVTQSGAAGGSYSASPSGLSINSMSGLITPAASQTGNYTVTYLVPGGGGCPPVSTTTVVSILRLPTAMISYAGPFTQNQGPQSVVLTGTDDYLGGSFSSTAGLVINATTGEITPSASTSGTYTVTYSKIAVSPCSDDLIVSTSVTIYGLPSAEIDVAGQPVCLGNADPVITFTGSAGAPPYTFVYNINDGINQDISAIAGESTVTLDHSSLIAGTYTYKIKSVTDGNSSTRTYSAGTEPTISITVTTPKIATFEYPGSPYCSNGSTAEPSFLGGGVAGTFSSTIGLVFADVNTGEIELSLSTSGSYTVTNTIPAQGGCNVISATANITITALPDATFNYAEAYCNNGVNPLPQLDGTAQIGNLSVTPPGLVFADLTSGEINLAASVPGNYTITNTILAADGCSVVVSTDEVTIQPLPIVTNDDELIICSNTNTNLLLSSSIPSTFTWTIGTITGNITGASGGSGSIIDQTLVNPSNVTSGTVEYIVVPTSTQSGCIGEAFVITVTVKPLPVLTSAINPQSICSALAFEYEATSSITGAAFSWNRSIVAGINEEASTGNTSIINEVLTNSSNAAINVVYVFTLTADGCSNTQNVTVGVNPTPSVTNNDLAQAFCSGGTSAEVILTSDIIGATLSWIAYPSAGITGYASIGTGTIPAQTLHNSQTTDGVVTYVIAPTLGNCYGSEVDYVITVHGLPLAPVANNVTVTYTGTSHSASADVAVGAEVVWYDASTNGNIITAPTGINVGAYTAWAEARVLATGCISTQRTLVTLTINALEITITASSDTKVYDGLALSNSNYSITAGSLANDQSLDAVTITGSQTVVGASNNVPSGAIITGAGSVNVTSNYSITYSNGLLTVTARLLELTASNINKTYGETYTFNNDEYSITNNTSLAAGETLTLELSSDGAEVSAPIGAYDIHLRSITVMSGASNVTSNYSITPVSGTLTVGQRAITITANSQTKVYDGTPLTNAGYSITGGSLVSGHSLISVTNTGTQTNVGSTANVSGTATIHNNASENVTTNYNVSYIAGSLEVTQKALTIKADDKAKGVGENDPTFTVTFNGFVDGENQSNLNGTLTTERESGEVEGTYVITAAGLTSDNYAITYQTGILTIGDVIVESSGGTARAGYFTLEAAFDAIEAGIHTGTVTVYVYSNLNEASGAHLDMNTQNNMASTVTVVPVNSTTITGGVTLEATNEIP